jgi:adenosylcobinamide-phosphate synthase
MASAIYLIIPLLAGYLLDLFFGDPAWLPHPVRAFGWLIEKGESWLNRAPFAKTPFTFVKGMVLTLFLCIGVYILLHWSLTILWTLNIPLFLTVSSVCVFYGLANRQLITEGKMVFGVLKREGVEAGRLQLSRIVGRDTARLGSQQIRIAVMETMSENLGDGVIAPLFWYAVAGVPGMMTYKMINTLDSMIGYRSERYEQFGKFAARLDDLANFIPARLTALLMVIVTASRKGAGFALRYGHLHKSPNAGYPEAALAGILDVRFGGPNSYQGLLVDKPFIGSNNREIAAEEIRTVIGINHRVCLLMVALVLLVILNFRKISEACPGIL